MQSHLHPCPFHLFFQEKKKVLQIPFFRRNGGKVEIPSEPIRFFPEGDLMSPPIRDDRGFHPRRTAPDHQKPLLPSGWFSFKLLSPFPPPG